MTTERHPTWVLAEDDESVVILPARTWDAMNTAARQHGGIPYVDETWARRGLQNLLVWSDDHEGRYIVLVRGES
jgi:hypothetical protein